MAVRALQKGLWSFQSEAAQAGEQYLTRRQAEQRERGEEGEEGEKQAKQAVEAMAREGTGAVSILA